MDELNHLLQAELDSEGLLKKAESKQIKGFSPTGIKSFFYLGENLLQVQDAGGGSSYLMSFLEFVRITETFPFKEKSLDSAKSNLFSKNQVIIDYNSYKVFTKEPDKIKSPIGEYLRDAKENYDHNDSAYNPELISEDDFHSLNNKT